jgi:hypothetical protein
MRAMMFAARPVDVTDIGESVSRVDISDQESAGG